MALVCSIGHPEAVDDDELAAEQLRTVAGRAADHGLTHRLRGVGLGPARAHW